MSAGRVLLLVAVICFVLAALPAVTLGVGLVPLGLAFFAASFLVS